MFFLDCKGCILYVLCCLLKRKFIKIMDKGTDFAFTTQMITQKKTKEKKKTLLGCKKNAFSDQNVV